MSATDDVPSEELEAAIAENPEAVAAFVRRLDAVNELLDVLATEETADLAAAVGGNGTELQETVELLATLQRRGTLDDLAELAAVGSLATAALDDEMVRSLAKTGSGLGEVAQTAAEEDTRDGLETLLGGIGAAERDDPEPVGALGLVRGIRDPEVQYGLGYLLAVARAIGRDRAGCER